jgi:archaellum component FlaC
MRQNRSDEHILTENAQLRESIDVLTKQIEYWKRQHSKQADEIQELNAFMDELENQTDLKSMIGQIRLYLAN